MDYELQEKVCEKCKLKGIRSVNGQVKCTNCGFIYELNEITNENEVNHNDDDERVVEERGVFMQNQIHDDDPFFLGNNRINTASNNTQEKNHKAKQNIQGLQRNIISWAKSMDCQQIIIDTAIKEFTKSCNEERSNSNQKQNKNIKTQAGIVLFKAIKSIMDPDKDSTAKIIKQLSLESNIEVKCFEKVLSKLCTKTREKASVKALSKCTELKLSDDDKLNMQLIDKKIQELELVGGEKANTVAGVLVFLTCQKSKNQQLKNYTLKQVCDICGFTENTVKKFYEKYVKEKRSNFNL